MRSEPHVACVCLTADRQEMTARALQCFRAQDYATKTLLIFDSGLIPFESELGPDEVYFRAAEHRGETIGALRNAANALCGDADIIAHWDSDDISASFRLPQQVALLNQQDAVGYTDMLFWNGSEAWLCTPPPKPCYLLGTSLLYSRGAWERRPFEAIQRGEDYRWLRGVHARGVSSLASGEPAMVATIHGSNTSSRVEPSSNNWKRAPEWAERLRAAVVI